MGPVGSQAERGHGARASPSAEIRGRRIHAFECKTYAFFSALVVSGNKTAREAARQMRARGISR